MPQPLERILKGFERADRAFQRLSSEREQWIPDFMGAAGAVLTTKGKPYREEYTGSQGFFHKVGRVWVTESVQVNSRDFVYLRGHQPVDPNNSENFQDGFNKIEIVLGSKLSGQEDASIKDLYSVGLNPPKAFVRNATEVGRSDMQRASDIAMQIDENLPPRSDDISQMEVPRGYQYDSFVALGYIDENEQMRWFFEEPRQEATPEGLRI